MQASYQVELTATAEATYTALHNDAAECIEKGDRSNGKVALLASVEEALNETIPINPFHSGRALAGLLSRMYRLNVGSLCIYYMPDPQRRAVVIIHIGPAPNGNDLAWFKEMVRNGNPRAVGILEKIGIDRSHLLEDAPQVSRWLN
jgi:mRNA-degrading endonuclease RelE of RelBE toxin-antitoxin system